MPQNENLIISIAKLHSQLLKRVDQQLSVHGISFTEFLVMHHLYDAPNKTMRRIDLAECIGFSASGVTRLVNPMEKNHLVRKEINARDARVSLVRLSTIGRATVSKTVGCGFDSCTPCYSTPPEARAGLWR